MLAQLVDYLKGAVSITAIAAYTVALATPLVALGLAKLALPVAAWHRLITRATEGIATAWVGLNGLVSTMVGRVRWRVEGDADLNPKGRYLVLANHQSWVDILVLQKIFHRRIPFLRFFLKSSLLYVPVMGLCWWALDFPFMKRPSRAKLKRSPHLKGRDIDAAVRACRKMAGLPTAMMNFVEGTRFTPGKHDSQGSPYERLLRPKAGGAAAVLKAMGQRLEGVLDVTIAYPGGPCTFWDYLCGRVREVRVRVERVLVTPELIGDYGADPAFSQSFQNWLNQRWETKDQTLGQMLKALPAPAPAPAAAQEG